MSINAFSKQGQSVCMLVTSTAHAGVKITGGSTFGSPQYRVYNQGPNDVFIAKSVSASVLAAIPIDGTPANGMCIPNGGVEVFSVTPNCYFSAICATGQTATLYITPGDGL